MSEPQKPANLHDLVVRVDDRMLARLQAELVAWRLDAPQMRRRHWQPLTILKREEQGAGE